MALLIASIRSTVIADCMDHAIGIVAEGVCTYVVIKRRCCLLNHREIDTAAHTSMFHVSQCSAEWIGRIDRVCVARHGVVRTLAMLRVSWCMETCGLSKKGRQSCSTVRKTTYFDYRNNQTNTHTHTHIHLRQYTSAQKSFLERSKRRPAGPRIERITLSLASSVLIENDKYKHKEGQQSIVGDATNPNDSAILCEPICAPCVREIPEA